jgi:hypothetical protein
MHKTALLALVTYLLLSGVSQGTDVWVKGHPRYAEGFGPIVPASSFRPFWTERHRVYQVCKFTEPCWTDRRGLAQCRTVPICFTETGWW